MQSLLHYRKVFLMDKLQELNSLLTSPILTPAERKRVQEQQQVIILGLTQYRNSLEH